MGVKVLTNFTTPEGFLVTEVYVRIVFMSFNLESNIATLQQEFSTSRDSRLQSQRLPRVPFTTDVVSFSARAFPTIDMVYFHLKRYLTKLGLTVEDVLEDGQEPSTYTEPEEIESPAQTDAVGAFVPAPAPTPAVE
jgi:hypothetical protein